MATKKTDRVAIVAGARSPFTRAWSTLNDVGPIQLSTQVAREVLFGVDLDLAEVDQVVWGTVVSVTHAPNVAREVALDLGMYRTPAFTVSRACASGFEAIASAARLIMLGEADVVLAGGVDVTSAAPVTYDKGVIDTLQKAQKQKGLGLLRTIADVNPLKLIPTAPAIAERYTGKTMGEHAEDMAKFFQIPRQEQDAYAADSHRKAFAAVQSGAAKEQIVPIRTPKGYVSEDNLIRESMDPAKLATLRPVFDPKYGSITAASSSALTDGASAVLLMKESKAKALGYEPLGFVKGWSFPAIDPRVNMLLGNIYSVPQALARAGVTMDDMDLFEVHEAFAAQVLSNLACFADDAWCQENMGLKKAPGAIPADKLNIWGGSLAYGHPFAATGGRLAINILHALRATDGTLGVATACAAGGLGAAMVFERGN